MSVLKKEQIANAIMARDIDRRADGSVKHPFASDCLDTIVDRDAQLAAAQQRIETLTEALVDMMPTIEFYAKREINSPSNHQEFARQTQDNLDRLRAALAEPSAAGKPTDDDLSKGTFACPICGRGFPHSADAHKSVEPQVPDDGLCQAHFMFDGIAYICFREFGHDGQHDWKYRANGPTGHGAASHPQETEGEKG